MSKSESPAFPGEWWNHGDLNATAPDGQIVPPDGGVRMTGLTKREYFAIHADQPGVAEIVRAAGLHSPDNFYVWKDAETKVGNFNEWYSALPDAERFRLWARVRVQMADALIAELAKATP